MPYLYPPQIILKKNFTLYYQGVSSCSQDLYVGHAYQCLICVCVCVCVCVELFVPVPTGALYG